MVHTIPLGKAPQKDSGVASPRAAPHLQSNLTEWLHQVNGVHRMGQIEQWLKIYSGYLGGVLTAEEVVGKNTGLAFFQPPWSCDHLI